MNSKNKKRFFSRMSASALAFILMFTSAFATAAADTGEFAASEASEAAQQTASQSERPESSTDYTGHWAETAIKYVLDKGYMTTENEKSDIENTITDFQSLQENKAPEEGKQESGSECAESTNSVAVEMTGSFLPDADMTRQMLVSSLHKIALVVEDEKEADKAAENTLFGVEEQPASKIEENSGNAPESVVFGIEEEQKLPETDADLVSESMKTNSDKADFSVFADLTGDEDYAEDALWAYNAGIINGIDGNFCADMAVDRQTVAVMLLRTVNYLKIDLTEDWSVMIDYEDLDEVSEWAVEGIAYCAMTDLMSGNADGSFAPKSSLTRAQGAVIIERLDEKIHSENIAWQ